MSSTPHKLALAAMALGGLFAFSPAHAQSTWNLFNGEAANREGVLSGCTQSGTNTGSFNNSYNCFVGPSGPTRQSVTVSAWSADVDRGDPNITNGNATVQTDARSYALTGSGFASAFISAQGNSGFGSTSRVEAQSARTGGNTTPLDPSSPNHSFDSIAPGSYDMMLLDFGSSSVILNKIGIGWTSGDADITLLRWTGTTAPTGTPGGSGMSGDGHENLSSTLFDPLKPNIAGWELVNSYANLGTDNTTPFGAPGSARDTGATKASSWWLISAFDRGLNGDSSNCLSATGTATTCGSTNDGFKLNFIATTNGGSPPTGAPEPGSLALAGLALAGLIGMRRRTPRRA